MKKTFCLLLFLRFSILPILAQQAPTSYFYLDTGCQSCNLDTVKQNGNYWVITKKTFQANLDKQEIDQIWQDFKKYIRANFTNPEPILNSVTLRHLETQEDIERSRIAKIEKMQRRNYQIIEVDYLPSTSPK